MRDERENIGESMNVLHVSDYQYQVRVGGILEGFIDLCERMCDCRVFKLDKLVCAHAITAYMFRRIDHVIIYSHFYLKDSLLQAYEEPIMLVGDTRRDPRTKSISSSCINNYQLT